MITESPLNNSALKNFKARLEAWLIPPLLFVMIERPAYWRSLDELLSALETSADKLHESLSKAKGSDKDKATLRHVIGMERWGQRRLRVALGEENPNDEHHAYKPDANSTWEELLQAFQSARQETLDLGYSLAAKEVDLNQGIAHNQFGDMSVKAWLRYLHLHAWAEARHIKG